MAVDAAPQSAATARPNTNRIRSCSRAPRHQRRPTATVCANGNRPLARGVPQMLANPLSVRATNHTPCRVAANLDCRVRYRVASWSGLSSVVALLACANATFAPSLDKWTARRNRDSVTALLTDSILKRSRRSCRNIARDSRDGIA